jgi:uncharacterized protein
MIFHREYTEIPEREIDRFVQSHELGRLVTVGGDGTPHLGLYPFVRAGERIEIHLNRADEQVADLRARPRAIFEVDDVLGAIPSYWVHPESAAYATAYHRTVIFECVASVSEDVEVIAAQQRRLLARYQPEGGFRVVDATDPLYHTMLGKLAAVTLQITRCRPKWKLAQNRPEESRRAVIAELRRRGRPTDGPAADALEWTLSAEAQTPLDGAAARPRA